MDASAKRRWYTLAIAAYADSQLSAPEMECLEKLRAELEISEKDAAGMAAAARTNRKLELPAQREAQLDLLHEMASLFRADGVVNEAERKMFLAVASHINIPESEADALLREAPASSAQPEIFLHKKTGIEFVRVKPGNFMSDPWVRRP